MTDKTTPEGFARAKSTEDDVEGHISRQRVEGEGFARAKVDGEGFARAKVDGEGFARAKSTEDDVEGHISRQRVEGEGFARAKVDGEGFARAKTSGEDDDVEGHSILDPFAARELARARERDVQQHAKRHEYERDARDAKKGRS
jgi:hypothetical protein